MVVVLHFSCNRCRFFAPSNARVSSSVLWRGISRVPAIGCTCLEGRSARLCIPLNSRAASRIYAFPTLNKNCSQPSKDFVILSGVTLWRLYFSLKNFSVPTSLTDSGLCKLSKMNYIMKYHFVNTGNEILLLLHQTYLSVRLLPILRCHK